jgi:DNA-binding protein Fis
MLHEFLSANIVEIAARTRSRIAARADRGPVGSGLDDGVPLFLSRLIAGLCLAGLDGGALDQSAARHGGELLAQGFTVSQVVHAYGDIGEVVTALARETGASIAADELHAFHRHLNNALACSVTEYQRRRDAAGGPAGPARLGALAREMGGQIDGALGAFAKLREGSAGIGGSTGALLGCNLRALRDTVSDEIAGVRLQCVLADVVRTHVLEAFGASGDNLSQTARTLGISRVALRRHLREYGVKPPKVRP